MSFRCELPSKPKKGHASPAREPPTEERLAQLRQRAKLQLPM